MAEDSWVQLWSVRRRPLEGSIVKTDKRSAPQRKRPHLKFSSALMTWWASLEAWMDLKNNRTHTQRSLELIIRSLKHFVAFGVLMQCKFTFSVFNSLFFINIRGTLKALPFKISSFHTIWKKFPLKGNTTNLTHQSVLTGPGENYCRWE